MNRLGQWDLRLGLLAGRLIEDDHATPVTLPQLNIGVQQLDATDRAIGSQIHIDRVAPIPAAHVVTACIASHQSSWCMRHTPTTIRLAEPF